MSSRPCSPPCRRSPSSVRKLGAAPGPLTFGVMRAYLVWLVCLVPALYEVVQCTLSLSLVGHSIFPLSLL